MTLDLPPSDGREGTADPATRVGRSLRARIARPLARLGILLPGSVHKEVLSAALVVAFFTFAAKIASAAKEVVVAKQFGTADQVDAFLIAWLMPSFILSVVGGSLNYAFMPIYVEYRQRRGAPAGQALLSSTLAMTLVCLAPLVVLLAVGMPFVLPLLTRGFNPQKARLVLELFWLLIPALMVSATTTTLTGVLNAHGRFARPAAAAMAIPAVTISVLLLFSGRWGIYAFAVGTVGGYLAEAVLVVQSVWREGLSVLPRWRGVDDGLRRVFMRFVPSASAMLFTSVNPVIDQTMASWLAPGSVASLGYGNKLVAFGVGIGATSIASSMLPHFSRLTAEKDWDGLNRSIKSYALLVSVVAIPITIAMIAFSTPIVRILFERGAFTRTDTLQVARIQAFYLVQIPFVMVSVFFNRFLVATGGNKILLRVSTAAAVLNVTANYVLLRVLGVSGIALSTSLVYMLTCAMNFFYFRQRLRLLRAGALAGADRQGFAEHA
jgi:putative peptidoglycan lipid II flippase